ncbi:MAG: hypothetical protein ACYC6G_19005 [Desulfobaccales bacterium]
MNIPEGLRPREIRLFDMEEMGVARAINKALARAKDGLLKMIILTLPGEGTPEHLEIIDKDEETGTVIQAWATGEAKGGYIKGLMRHKDDTARLSEVGIPLAGLQAIFLQYQEMPKAIHRHRRKKRAYTAEQIAAATGMTVAEVERRAAREGWAYLGG